MGQKDPLVEYKQESYKMFEELMRRIRNETIHRVLRVQVAQIPKRVLEKVRA
jgi:preprotein translocase subunit SecA